MKFRKKPIVIEAWKLDFDNLIEMQKLTKSKFWCPPGLPMNCISGIIIETLEGDMYCAFGDWIIKGIEEEFYPCKDSIFQATYEKVDDEKTD